LTLYLDTSVLVTLLTVEPRTNEIQNWIALQSGAEFLSSDWTVAEVSSALSLKMRTGTLTADRRAAALSALSDLLTGNVTVLPIRRSDFYLAARLCALSEHGLRSPDALHLAVCARHAATLCTLDRRQAAAGPALGIPTTLL
jgi:predicted nucleic acid-binding protein